MICAYCQKPVRWWQSRMPLGGGLLPDSFGQFEHSDCQGARFKLIAASNIKFQAIIDAARAIVAWPDKPE